MRAQRSQEVVSGQLVVLLVGHSRLWEQVGEGQACPSVGKGRAAQVAARRAARWPQPCAGRRKQTGIDASMAEVQAGPQRQTC